MSEPSFAEMRAIEQAATEGPWEAEYSREQGNCVIPHDAASTREAVATTRLYHQIGDAEFIAAARTFVPKALSAFDAVLALHPMETMQVLDREDCARDECGHAGECPTVSFDICRGCFDRAMEIYMYYAGGDISGVAYPCPDVVAIEKAFTT